MREAIGSSLLLNIVLVFVSLIILFFVGILSYTKAYRAKNRIVDVIEKYGTYNTYNNPMKQEASDEIESSLKEMGYQLGDCKKTDGDLNNTNYKYCVYEVCMSKKDAEGKCPGKKYYKVTTYVQFYVPIIGELINPPVYGETRILGKSYNY